MTELNTQASAKPKIMLVDDETHNLDLLYRTFRRQFQIFKAENAINALEILAQEGEMAVIISDQFMPQMNGIEFLEKTLTPFPHTIRILLSGLGEDELEGGSQAIRQANIFKVITKPCNVDELKTLVQEAIEIYQSAKQKNQ